MLPLLMMLPDPRFFYGAACFMPSMTLRTSVAREGIDIEAPRCRRSALGRRH
jgi:hypothetical protein